MDHRKTVFRLNLRFDISNITMFNNPNTKLIYKKPDIKILHTNRDNLFKLYRNRKIKTLHHDDPNHSQR